MLTQNFTHFLGHQIELVLPQIEESFFGRVVVVTPASQIDENVQSSRLQVHVDDFGLITKIVHG